MTLTPKQRNRIVTACYWFSFLLSAFGVYLSTCGGLDWAGIAVCGTVMGFNAADILREPKRSA